MSIETQLERIAIACETLVQMGQATPAARAAEPAEMAGQMADTSPTYLHPAPPPPQPAAVPAAPMPTPVAPAAPAAPVAPAAPAAPAVPEAPAAPADLDDTAAFKQMKAHVQAIQQQLGTNAHLIVKVMQEEFKVEKLSALPREMYEQFILRLQQLVSQ